MTLRLVFQKARPRRRRRLRLRLPHVHWHNRPVEDPYELTPLFACRCGQTREGI